MVCPGIVNHHVAYTLELEQVLQTIAPSVSVPYWEYTIDAMLDSWEDSVIFGEDWFGVVRPTAQPTFLQPNPERRFL